MDIKAVALNLDVYLACLTEEETQRKDRFLKQEDALRFVGGRYLIHKYMPGQIKFTDLQKPYIDGASSFSLSHAGQKVVLAIASDGLVGIDIEGGREKSIEDIIDRTTTEFEKERIKNDSDFYLAWTKKEAVMKLTGLGLGLDPRCIETIKYAPKISCKNLQYYSKSLQIGDLWLSVCADKPFDEFELIDVD